MFNLFKNEIKKLFQIETEEDKEKFAFINFLFVLFYTIIIIYAII